MAGKGVGKKESGVGGGEGYGGSPPGRSEAREILMKLGY